MVGAAVYVNREIVFSSLGGAHRFELEQLRRTMWTDLVRFGLVSGLGIWMLRRAFRLRITDCGLRVGMVRWGVPALILADLFSFGAKLNPTIDSKVYTETPESVRFLKEDPGLHRVLSMVSEENSPFRWHEGWRHDRRSFRDYPELVKMYTGSVYDLSNFEPGWSPLHLERHWSFLGILTGRLLSLANVKYVVTYGPMTRPGFELVFEGRAVRIYENADVLPRAFLVHRFRVIEPARARLRALSRPEFAPDRTVILEEPPEDLIGDPALGASSAEIVAYGPGEVRVAVDTQAEGFLVLTDMYYPGWTAYVDGQEEQIYRADHLFRAVLLGPGRHEVRFVYRPASFVLGAWVSLGVFVLTLGALVWTIRKRTRVLPEVEGVPDTECPRALAYMIGLVVVALVVTAISAAVQFELWRDAWSRCSALDIWGS